MAIGEDTGDNLMLYRNFYSGDTAREVYQKIIEDPELRPENMETSYEEWLNAEQYDGTGLVKMPTLNEYYYLSARRMMLNTIFNCRFRIDKNELLLTRIFLSGPQYKIINKANPEIDAFFKMFTEKYGEPAWENINESETEILNLADVHTYTWKYIWEITDDQGKKEIKAGTLTRIDNQKNEIHSSIISLEYIDNPKISPPEEKIKEEDIKDVTDDF